MGTAAKPSARMLKSIARFPTFVISHKSNPKIERIPQAISKTPNFHPAFLFKNEAKNTSSGIKPTIKVVKDYMPTPCFISAANAISGATAHKSQVTLFGLTFPLIVSIK